MKKIILLTSSLLGAALACWQPVSAETLPDGYQPIFNGKDLSGWHARTHFDPRKFDLESGEQQAERKKEWMAEAEKHWTVENGELVNDGAGPYLTTDKYFEDYELVLEYKTVPKADSGIYLKANPQVQIWDVGNEKQFHLGSLLGSGGLWNNSPGAKGKDPFVLADKPHGKWNKVRVRQIGSRTSVWLNGRMLVDHAIMENYFHRGEPLERRGVIQLQTHGGEIRWRNVGVKELSTHQANKFLLQYHRRTFKSLFNRKDLSGWQGATDNYEVIDGTIRCKTGKGGNLLTQEEYADFIARVEFKLPPGGNNGLAIRAPIDADTAYNGFCELQILDTEHPKYKDLDPRQVHGSPYGMVAAIRGYLREQGQWNVEEVTIDGTRVKVELNGNVIVDADLAEAKDFLDGKEHPGLSRKTGFFGLAGHNDPVEFRTVLIRRITHP